MFKYLTNYASSGSYQWVGVGVPGYMHVYFCLLLGLSVCLSVCLSDCQFNITIYIPSTINDIRH